MIESRWSVTDALIERVCVKNSREIDPTSGRGMITFFLLLFSFANSRLYGKFCCYIFLLFFIYLYNWILSFLTVNMNDIYLYWDRLRSLILRWMISTVNICVVNFCMEKDFVDWVTWKFWICYLNIFFCLLCNSILEFNN